MDLAATTQPADHPILTSRSDRRTHARLRRSGSTALSFRAWLRTAARGRSVSPKLAAVLAGGRRG